MSRQWSTLMVLVVFLLAILGFRGYMGSTGDNSSKRRAMRDIGNETTPEDVANLDRRKEILKQRKKVGEAEKPTAASEEESLPEWRGRSPNEISIENTEWALEADKAEEIEKSGFLPMLEKFVPLDPEPILALRTFVLDHVASGLEQEFSLPGEDAKLKSVDADGMYLIAKKAAGDKIRIAWEDLPNENLYELARSAIESGKRSPTAREYLHMSHFADMVGKGEDSTKYGNKAAELDSGLIEALQSGPSIVLDKRVLNEYSWPWDDPKDPRPANNLSDDAPSIVHVYRYMRTKGMDALRAEALRNPQYSGILRRPAEFRGKVLRLEAQYVKRYQSMRMTDVRGHRQAGLRDLDMCFVVDAHVMGFYLVSAPHDLRKFRDGDIVTLTGVYVRRWPYIRHGQWKWVPWIAALSVEPFEIEPIKGWRTATYILVAGALVVFLAVAYYARRDQKEVAVMRDKLHRMRGGRDHIRRKVAEAMAVNKDGDSSPEKSEDDKKG